ncbi:cytidine deaminase [Cyclospora cayetanensis]|uniref:Cytidine deaminase n=1 Tax=Cyclospora cayetanensis TaxID=88456 RepID=A0A1D3D9N8_9EIME|nr:cytidine deaminase [Cyclospora cayetanensis]
MEPDRAYLEERRSALMEAAFESAHNAFASYSKQRTGVSVYGTDGKIYRGCTFDSAAFPCSICAAHVAVSQAATKGRALVLCFQFSVPAYPHGDPLTLQAWLCEYAHPHEVYIHCAVVQGNENPNAASTTAHKLSDLLPLGQRLPLPPLPCQRSSPLAIGEIELEDEDGIVTGANAETSALGIGCCAEQSAIGAAAALGRKRILKAVVICTTMSQGPCHPCGRCLQLLMQAQENMRAALALRSSEGKQQNPPSSWEGPPAQLVLLMPWRHQVDGKFKWRLKARRLDELGAEDRFML